MACACGCESKTASYLLSLVHKSVHCWVLWLTMYTSKHSCRRETARSSILYWKCLYNVMRQVYTPCIYFCRAMLCMRGLCRHAVSVSLSIRPSVCLSVTFVYFNKHTPIFKIYLPSGSHTILVCPWHSGGNAPHGCVECRWGRQKSRFWANLSPSRAVNAATGRVLSTRCRRTVASCDTVILISGSKRRSLLMADFFSTKQSRAMISIDDQSEVHTWAFQTTQYMMPKIQDGGRPPYWKSFLAIIQQPIARFQWNFAWRNSFSQNFANWTDTRSTEPISCFPNTVWVSGIGGFSYHFG